MAEDLASRQAHCGPLATLHMLQPMKQLLLEVDDEIADGLERMAPGLSRAAVLISNSSRIGVVALALLVAACGSGSEVPTASPGTSTRTTAARRAGGEVRARRRTGRTRSTIQTLPNDAAPQREQLVRRLAAQDCSIDLMSLDPPFVAEFANAGFLRRHRRGRRRPADRGRPRGPAARRRTGTDRLVARAVLGQHPAALVPQVGRRGRGRRPDAARTSPGTR